MKPPARFTLAWYFHEGPFKVAEIPSYTRPFAVVNEQGNIYATFKTEYMAAANASSWNTLAALHCMTEMP